MAISDFNLKDKISTPEAKFKWHYEIGQRVKHGERTGTISSRYDMVSAHCGYYPEIYVVNFDDGKTERGFLWHGLKIA